MRCSPVEIAEREYRAYLQTINSQIGDIRMPVGIPTWLGIGSNLRQLELATDGVAAVGCDPALDALGAVVAETHAAAVDGVDLGVRVEVADACAQGD